MHLQCGCNCVGKDRDAILLPLAVAHDDLRIVEIDVLHAQPQCLHETQAAAVQQLADEMELWLDLRQ